jgi:ubiquitin carboxyl-terminal hydrolase 7
MCSSPIAFYDFLQNRVLLLFKPKFEDQGGEEFELVMSKKANYELVSCVFSCTSFSSLISVPF